MAFWCFGAFAFYVAAWILGVGDLAAWFVAANDLFLSVNYCLRA
jgi:hypothetical protein